MADDSRMGRKDFLARCGAAALGLSLGASCDRGGEAAAAGRAGDGVTLELPGEPGYRYLGRQAKLKVTEIGFGASRTMDPTLVNFAIERGINFLDTGRSYFNGQNEQMVGEVIRGRRDQVVINSKVRPGDPAKMRQDLETSLQALGTDCIDCLLLHDIGDPVALNSEPYREFFSRAREQGQVRTFGFSTHGPFVEMLDAAVAGGFYEVIMLPYNFMGGYTHMLGGNTASWDAPAQEQAIDRCGKAGIDFIAIKSASGGFLKDGSGPRTYPAALKWILQSPYMKTTATAMGNFQQIEECLQALNGGALSAEEQGLLDRYAALYGDMYCRMCGSCNGQCPRGVNAREVNRLHMYAVGYGGEMARQARRDYPDLGDSGAAACLTCDRCRVECPYGLPLGRKLRAAHSVLS